MRSWSYDAALDEADELTDSRDGGDDELGLGLPLVYGEEVVHHMDLGERHASVGVVQPLGTVFQAATPRTIRRPRQSTGERPVVIMLHCCIVGINCFSRLPRLLIVL